MYFRYLMSFLYVSCSCSFFPSFMATAVPLLFNGYSFSSSFRVYRLCLGCLSLSQAEPAMNCVTWILQFLSRDPCHIWIDQSPLSDLLGCNYVLFFFYLDISVCLSEQNQEGFACGTGCWGIWNKKWLALWRKGLKRLSVFYRSEGW